VVLPDGVTGLQGVNVIARRTDAPQAIAVSCVSGYLDRETPRSPRDPARIGDFVIPGLPPGTYTVEIQQLQESPSIRGQGYLIGGARFWREGAAARDRTGLFTPILVNAGQEVRGIEVVVNGESLGEPRQVRAQTPNALPDAQAVSLPVVISGELPGGPEPPFPIETVEALSSVYAVNLREWTTVTALLSAAQPQADLDLYVVQQAAEGWNQEGASKDAGTPPEVLQLRLAPGRHYFGVVRAGTSGSPYTLRLLATPAPDPDRTPEKVFLAYLSIGEVTRTSAVARWQTTGDVPSVLYYNQPLREIGSTPPVREHALPLTDLAPGANGEARVIVPSAGALFGVAAPLTTAKLSSREGKASFITQKKVTSYGPDFAEVQVRFVNTGDGDAVSVQIEEIIPAPGWELQLKELVPKPLKLGRIGAGGAGAVVVWLFRRSGSAAPSVTIRGTYREAESSP
jgi:hypothetical protein